MQFRWRIKQKLGAGLLLVVGMFALLSGGAFYGLYSYRHSNKTFDNNHRQLQLLENLVMAVSELHVISPYPSSPELRDPRVSRIENIERCLSDYRTNLEHGTANGYISDFGSRQYHEVDEMQRVVAEIRSELTGNIYSTNAETTGVPNILKIDKLRRLLNMLSTSLMRLQGHTHTEVHQYVEVDRANYRTAMGIVYSTSVLVLVLMSLLVWLGYRLIFYPIRHLHKCVVKLAAGQFDSRSKLDTGDEMQELGESFNDMADKLQAMYRGLNRQVEERSRQLIRSERLASVGFLAAGVAHEINNPLASIAFCAEALQGRVAGFLPAENPEAEVVKNYLGMIEEEAFRCKAITEKLLDFSRAGVPERIETDLVALARDVIEMVSHLGRARNKSLLFEPQETVFCQANPQELKQVLLNLVVNALESVDEGGEVVVTIRNIENQVEISVRDNGCGMTPDVLENLFEPFFTRSRTGKGTGLGLSISHLIVSQHGGTLEAASEGPNTGSTFTVKLPLRARVRMASAA